MVVAGEQPVEQCHDILFKTGRAVIGVERQEPHKVVPCGGKLVGSRGGGGDGDVAVNLARVGRNDVALQEPGQLDGQACLARGCGAGYDNQFLQARK